jgi:hypothetical protein
MEHINFWAAAVSVLVYFFLGAIWYGKPLFATRWAKEIGMVMDPEKRPNILLPMLGQLVSTILYTAGMVFIINMTGCKCMYHSAMAALIVIVFFVFPINSGTLFFKNKPVLFLIEAGYQATGTIIISLILGLWK